MSSPVEHRSWFQSMCFTDGWSHRTLCTRHLGSSSSESPSCLSFFFFSFLLGWNVSRQTQKAGFHGCWAQRGSLAAASLMFGRMSIVFSKRHRRPQDGSRQTGSACLSAKSRAEPSGNEWTHDDARFQDRVAAAASEEAWIRSIL